MELRHYKHKDKNKLLIFLPEKINNNNIQEVTDSINKILDENDYKSVILEASELTYISSVGIRLLLKLRSSGVNLEILRLQPAVEEVLTQVGLNTVIPMFSSQKVVYLGKQKPMIETGHSATYQIEKDKALKVIKNETERDNVLREENSLREAFLLGIPTLIPYDYIRTTDGRYGLLFELPQAQTFETIIKDHPEREDEVIDTFIRMVKDLHSTEVPKTNSNTLLKEALVDDLYQKQVIDGNEKNKLNEFYSYIPEANTFLHTHLYPRNVIETTEGDNLFTHISELTSGHPILDLYRLYYYYYLLPEFNMEEFKERSFLPEEDAKRVADKVLRRYYQTESEDEMKKIRKNMRLLSLITYLEHINKEGAKVDSELNEKVKKEIFDLLKDIEMITF